jgi:hypothetical protein
MTPWRYLVVLICFAAVAPGCRLLDEPAAGKPLLTGARSSPDSVALEVFFARFPFKSPLVNESLWKEVDEQAIPSEVRRELTLNGFRAGVVGTTIPAELVQLLKLHEKQPQRDADQRDDQPNRTVLTAEQLEAEPAVTLRMLTAPAGRRCELLTSHTYESLSLLTRDEEGVRGKTYRNADGRFELKAFPQPQQRARLVLVPELHYGEQQQRWAGSDGVFRLEATRPHRTFSKLQLESTLAPGQMLLMTCSTDHPGSVGHYFFTEPSAESLIQKLLVIRVAGVGAGGEGPSSDEVKSLDLGVELKE